MSDMSPAEPPRLAPGTRLNGVFEIDRYVASGRAGEIYRAHAVETGDPAAIETMRADLAGDALALARFRREAYALHDVHHEAVVRYYLFSHDPGTGRHYLAMEFVDGPSLSALMQEGPLGPRAVHMLQQRVAAGLHVAHQHGVIHRHLSPASVLVPGRDPARAKIIGFGAGPADSRDGARIGGGAATVDSDYAAPEQFGLFGGDVTARTDIYSLGLVFAACLLGRPLDRGGTPLEITEKRCAVPDLHEIDERFRPLLERMLQPDPADRPESMAAVAAWRPSRQAAVPQRPGQPASLRRPEAAARRRLAMAAAAVVLVSGIGSAGFYLVSNGGFGLRPDYPWLTAPPDSRREDEGVAAAQGPAAGSRQRIIDFVNAYDGGGCFFITPETVEDGKAILDGLGSTVAPFEALDYEFKQRNGFEPSIGVHQVMAAQCPAVSFLFRTRRQQAAAPRLDAVTTALKEGGPLTGSLSDTGAGAVELLLVADDGYVRNLSLLLRQGGGASPAVRTFAIGIRKTTPGPPRPQLLMAVASARPLEAFRLPPDGTPASQVFPAALAEATRGGQTLSVSVKYFMLEK